jgi:hypothetical protein
MEHQNEDKEDKAADAIKCFLGQFGSSDIYMQIVLEEFFKELLDEQE